MSSSAGLVLIEIYTPVNQGPLRAAEIADKLDSYLAGKSLKTTSGGVTQFSDRSSLSYQGTDIDNASLVRSTVSIQFNHFGV